jgi:hypothetical protein
LLLSGDEIPAPPYPRLLLSRTLIGKVIPRLAL